MADEPIDDLSINNGEPSDFENDKELHDVNYISGMYKDWFLDYASYVILERAVPHLIDGFKTCSAQNIALHEAP
jgi:topoisomerase-4 subunit A